MEKGILFYCLLGIGAIAVIFQGIGCFAPAWMIFSMSVDSAKLEPTTPAPSQNFGFQDGDNFGNSDTSGFNEMGSSMSEQTKMSMDVSMGLWTMTVCMDVMGEHQCPTVTMDQLQQAMDQSTTTGEDSEMEGVGRMMAKDMIGDFRTLQALTILGGMAAVAGFCLLFAFGRADVDTGLRCKGISTALLWAISAIFVFAAVGMQAHQDELLNRGIRMIKAMPAVKDAIHMEAEFPWALMMSGVGAALSTVIALIVSLKMCMLGTTETPGSWNKFTNMAV